MVPGEHCQTDLLALRPYTFLCSRADENDLPRSPVTHTTSHLTRSKEMGQRCQPLGKAPGGVGWVYWQVPGRETALPDTGQGKLEDG